MKAKILFIKYKKMTYLFSQPAHKRILSTKKSFFFSFHRRIGIPRWYTHQNFVIFTFTILLQIFFFFFLFSLKEEVIYHNGISVKFCNLISHILSIFQSHLMNDDTSLQSRTDQPITLMNLPFD